MSGPQTLTRPLATRIAGLPEILERTDTPMIPEAVIDAALEALKAGRTHYTDRPGILGLRKWVSEHLQQFNIASKPDDVTITCGATEARFVIIKRLLSKDDTILCPGDPTLIEGAAHLTDTKIIHDLDQQHRVKLLYITPRDAPDIVEPLLAQAEQQGWWILWDMSSGQAKQFHPSQKAVLAPRVVSVGSFSDVMPGWRVGWMAGSEMADKLRAYKQSLTICTTSISQWAGIGIAET
ncbi:MAG: pyridoxal phosphate-dependent aminotransferase [Anaerolineae bacterium]|nr:pyridoxal phosphate-dependent aminotransferase [Anaerolineae bacterium]MBN8618767.1 pyridoxal phosphate-dependent aminotransferase [Anaerolineae bacterium]